MIFNNKKYAFSLTELLIVLVVLAVLFAALAPIITKRRNGSNIANESVWNYVNDDEQQRDAYYDPGVPGWPSIAYIGLDANRLNVTSPIAKVVIKASKTIDAQDSPQRQIQFRYGSGDGVNAGSLFFDDKGNLMLSGNNDSFVKNASLSGGNTIAGLGTFSRVGTSYNTTAFGANIMKGTSEGVNNNSIYTAVGQKILYNSSFGTNRKNIFIGANSGQSEPNSSSAGYLNQNIALGSKAMGSSGFYGSNNIALGYLVGNGENSRRARVNNNVLVGSQYYTQSTSGLFGLYRNSAQNNVILGYDTYIGGHPRISMLTAAGYWACSTMTAGTDGSRTCLGFHSGAGNGATPSTFHTDNYDHVFLGGTPEGGFNGRAVVEVHNQRSSKLGTLRNSNPNVSPTVVFNSNLVVRGGLNFAKNNGNLGRKRYAKIDRDPLDTRRNDDTCLRFFGKRWFQWSVWMFGGADSKSRNTMDFWGTCTDNLQSYSFNSRCPQLKVSDIRLKENITANHAGLDEIIALMPYNYTFKDDKAQKPQTGIIAQDLQKIFPASVTEGKDGYLRIRWDEMFYAAINSIKVLDKKLETLTTKITGMEKDVKLLKSSHRDLQRKITSLNIRAARLERK